MGKVVRIPASRGIGKKNSRTMSRMPGNCTKVQNKSLILCHTSAEEGSGDSIDESWSVLPARSLRSTSPCAEDGWDSTGSLSPPHPSRIAVIVRLPTSSGGRNPIRTNVMQPRPQVSDPCHAFPDTHMDPAYVEAVDRSTTRSEIGFQAVGGTAGGAVILSDGCNVSNTRQSYDYLMNSEEGMARRALVERLSQAAVRVSAGPRVLYLGISLLDAGLKMSRQSGRKMDCVQRQVLGVTCLYLACNHSTPFRCDVITLRALGVGHWALGHIMKVNSSADEFCNAAGLGQGSVKGCMITRQQQVVEGLLPCSLQSPFFSTRVLRDTMEVAGEISEEEHLAQFVLHLAGTEFGARHWDRTVLAAAMQVLSDRRGGGSGAERSIKILERVLLPPVKEYWGGALAGPPLSTLQQCGHGSGKRQSSVYVKYPTVACG